VAFKGPKILELGNAKSRQAHGFPEHYASQIPKEQKGALPMRPPSSQENGEQWIGHTLMLTFDRTQKCQGKKALGKKGGEQDLGYKPGREKKLHEK